eukprot:7538005-Alexandrium_andersonii.AAC.1
MAGKVLHDVILSCALTRRSLPLNEQIIYHPANDKGRPLVRLHSLEPMGRRGVVELVDGRRERRDGGAAL